MSPVPVLLALSAVVSAPATAAGGTGSPASEIVLKERQPMAMLVLTGKGSRSTISVSDIVRAASRAIEKRTDLVLLSEEQAGGGDATVRHCQDKNRLSCWVRAVRTDYDRVVLERPDGTVPSFDEIRAERARKKAAVAVYLLVISLYGEPGAPDRISAVLIDTDQALEPYHSADRRRPDWEEQVEDEIFQRVAQARALFHEIRDDAELEAYFEELFDRELREYFEKGGHWEPYGAIELATEVPGLAIELDGLHVGSTAAGVTRLAGALPGQRTIALSDPSGGFEPLRRGISVRRRETTKVELELVRSPARERPWTRGAVMWSGVGLATLGAVFAALAVFTEPAAQRLDVCAGGAPCDGMEPGGFVDFCDVTGGGASCLEGKKGVLVAPLGYSLVLTGGAFALGTGLFDSSDSDIPWIPIAVGIAAGALSYGLSAALDSGARPVQPGP